MLCKQSFKKITGMSPLLLLAWQTFHVGEYVSQYRVENRSNTKTEARVDNQFFVSYSVDPPACSMHLHEEQQEGSCFTTLASYGLVIRVFIPTTYVLLLSWAVGLELTLDHLMTAF